MSRRPKPYEDYLDKDAFCGIAEGGEEGHCLTHARELVGKPTISGVQNLVRRGDLDAFPPIAIWCGARMSAFLIPFGQILEYQDR